MLDHMRNYRDALFAGQMVSLEYYILFHIFLKK